MQLEIFEPPRFFEAFLRGRAFTEAPDITARICGICPVAYQMSAVPRDGGASAGSSVDGQLRALRRLLYCGEWIESHALHIFCCTRPTSSATTARSRWRATTASSSSGRCASRRSATSSWSVVGGREIHPVNVRVGGFYRVPTAGRARRARAGARVGRATPRSSTPLGGRLRLPRLRARLRVRGAAPAGRVPDRATAGSSRATGLDIDVAEFEQHFVEEHVRALERAARDARRARRLPRRAAGALRAQLRPSCRRSRARPPPRSGLGDVVPQPVPEHRRARRRDGLRVRRGAADHRRSYEPPDPAVRRGDPARRVGHGGSRGAARDLLAPLRARRRRARSSTRRSCRRPRRTRRRSRRTCVGVVQARRSHLPDDELAHRCEQAIRNYDPCISCATHFLRLEVERV